MFDSHTSPLDTASTASTASMISSELTVPLPHNYCRNAVRTFHVLTGAHLHANGTEEPVLRKAFIVGNTPCLLEALIGPVQARCRLITPNTSSLPQNFLPQLTSRMLGLWHSIDPFETDALCHLQLRELVRRQRGLVIPLIATPFEALSWSIITQRCDPVIASAYRQRLALYAGVPHPAGVQCYPDAIRVANLLPKEFGIMGIPPPMARTMSAISELIANGHLQLDILNTGNALLGTLRKRLEATPFLGSWTVNYTLMYGCGDIDCSWHDDVRLRRSLGRLLGRPGIVPRKEAHGWLEQFMPLRSLVAAHLWHSRA